jgi:hypothetical protein
MRSSSFETNQDVDTFAALQLPERLLIWGCRTWLACCRARNCPMDQLERVFSHFGAVEAAASLDALLCATAQTAIRAIDVRCPRCARLSEDEVRLLYAAAAAQRCDFETARAHLQHWLSAPVADWALGPTCGLGVLFKNTGLILPFRPEPEDLGDSVETTRDHGARRCHLH